MAKFFSVLAENQDGTTKLMPAQGNTPGDAFQQVKQMPGVRRVGKVSEISPADYDALLHGRQPAGMSARRHDRPPAHSAAELSAQPGQVDVHFKMKGPRVVLDARPSGGEQPFKNLNIPPERLKPFTPPPPVIRQVTAPARPAVPQPSVAPQPSFAVPSTPPAVETEAAPSALEYRVVKSRRAGGSPYLLQRGQWEQQNGKRTFKVEWEKGFDDRDKAEAHAGWVQRSVEELAAVGDSVE